MIELLRHFVHVADEGTLTAAARASHVTQPALTAALQRLEAKIGMPLVVRGRPRATLTAAGVALLPHARAALAAIRDGLRAVAEVSGLRAGNVRIGAGATACTYYLPPILAEYRQKYPGVGILVREASASELEEGMRAGELDLAIVSGRREGDPFCDDELVLVARSRAIAKDAPFVTFPRGAHAREVLGELFPEATIAMEIASIAAVKANVRAGVGIALVSRRAVARDLLSRQLVELPDARTPVRRQLTIVHHGLERLPPAARALHALLLERRPAPLRKKSARDKTRNARVNGRLVEP